MKITRKALKKLILKELFEKGAAAYAFKHSVDGRQKGEPDVHSYEFTSDHGLQYTVPVFAPKETFLGDVQYDGEWNVSFTAKDPNNPDANAYGLTGMNDMKVLNTVIQVVKDFVSNVRPTLPDPLHTFTHFKCEAQQERGIPGGDTRRGRIYQYMLKKQGIRSEISLDEYGSIILEFVI